MFFSIDLVRGEIFNADSLPVGTRIKALAATIVTDNSSAVTLHIPRPGQSDSVVDYLKNSADTIDFSNGPVRLEVTSQNGTTVKNYSIRINVHTMKSDSLCWGSEAIAPLPALSGATAQRTVQRGTAAYTFSTDGSRYSVAATSDFAAWDPAAFTPGFAMDVTSAVATDDKFYALATDGTLWSATQAAGPWSSEGLHFSCLYGAFGSEVVGLCTDVNGGIARRDALSLAQGCQRSRRHACQRILARSVPLRSRQRAGIPAHHSRRPRLRRTPHRRDLRLRRLLVGAAQPESTALRR